jgi:hypothetical protein
MSVVSPGGFDIFAISTMSDKFCIKCRHHQSKRSAIFRQGMFKTVHICKKTEVVFRDAVTGDKTNVMTFRCEVERSEAGRCGPQARFFEKRHFWIRDSDLWALLIQLVFFGGLALFGFYLFAVVILVFTGMEVPVNPWHWFF